MLHSLTSLNTGSNAIGQAGAAALAKGIVSLKELTMIDTGDNNDVDVMGAAELIRAGHKFAAINVIEFEDGGVTTGVIETPTRGLVKLKLKFVAHSTEESLALARAVRELTTLRELDLSGCEVGPEGGAGPCWLQWQNSSVLLYPYSDSVGTGSARAAPRSGPKPSGNFG